MMSDPERIEAAIELALRYGNIDGAHHRKWVIDQMVRILAGEEYPAVIAEYKRDGDDPDAYEWDEGIPP